MLFSHFIYPYSIHQISYTAVTFIQYLETSLIINEASKICFKKAENKTILVLKSKHIYVQIETTT